ncbi:uncharacterized protein ARMOST_07566 [Armillaria ostoyae]|uniref:Uncharacterized protein n=1 Tax=Armillaria ostoyae TaxID=47428 RepID=A0A284R673_ARMOS|nr:uncharacterized protein ARMOST_07566 [Armillaria ostoyae]
MEDDELSAVCSHIILSCKIERDDYTELNISPPNKHPPVHLMVARAERVDAVADAHLPAYASPCLAPISANFAPRPWGRGRLGDARKPSPDRRDLFHQCQFPSEDQSQIFMPT